MSVASETAVSTQTYRTWIEAEPAAIWEAITARQPRYEPAKHGATKITLVHDLEGAPVTAAIVGGVVVDAGGGWSWILSDLKTLLETGSALPVQLGDC